MLDALYNLNGLNNKIFLLVNKYTNKWLFPNILEFISSIFSIDNVSIYYLISFIFLIVYFKKSSLKNFWTLYNYAIKIAITYSLIVFSYALLKFTVNMPRPICSLKNNEFKTILPLDSARCLSSFPSAHVAFAVFLTYTLWPWLSEKQKILSIIIVILVAISRITLALHYPADIIYSIPLVFICILLGNIIFSLFKNNLIKKLGFILLKLLNNE